ncbi:hypothetical protein JCM8547_004901 [Rhodosporidiobolus lusitaniae]
MSATPSRRGVPAVLLLVALVGLACFARGFFPVKPLLPGFAAPRTYSSPSAEAAPFSRLAFVVVDALRSDFLLGPESHFSFAASLIATGHALPYTALAQAPTVTLPRLKALTTGSNPTFLDAILNVADESVSSAAFERVDSWLRQFVQREGKKVVFAGDDTWLRLFPERWFEWSEGVTSFFVSDTETVDTNITRHLDPLLSFSSPSTSPYPHDWDALTLHYLGLDHVGHLGGPQSPLMPPKQREMDRVIKRLYQYLERRDEEDGKKSLLVVIGDHGMTEGGNHGGSTSAETSSALLLAAPSLAAESAPPSRFKHDSPYHHYEVVQQIDLVPTLSVLFDMGIPTNSMGKLISSAVKALRPSALSSGLIANVQQVSAVLEAAGTGEAKRLLCEAREKSGRAFDGRSVDFAQEDEEVLLEFLSLSQSLLLSSTSSYSLPPLYIGLALLILSSLLFLHHFQPFLRFERRSTKLAVGGALLAYLGSFWASSFIEEEHEACYFLVASGLIGLAFRPTYNTLDRSLLLASAASVRLMRAWAHNGQKNVPNTSLSLSLSTSPSLPTLTTLTYASFLLLTFFHLFRTARLFSPRTSSPPQLLRQALVLAVIATTALGQAALGVGLHLLDFEAGEGEKGGAVEALGKLGLGSRTSVVRAGYVVALVGWGVARVARRNATDAVLRERYSTLTLLALLLVLLSLTRPSSTPLFLLFWIQHLTLHRLTKSGKLSPLGVAAWTAGMQAVGFFGLGGSNALASVDLSSSYTGLTSHSLPLVALLTYLSNFSLPVLSSLSLHTLLSSAPSPSRRLILNYLTFFHLAALTVLSASASWFREHLFSLTVFAPAVVYRATWLVWVQVGTNLGLSRVLAG